MKLIKIYTTMLSFTVIIRHIPSIKLISADHEICIIDPKNLRKSISLSFK